MRGWLVGIYHDTEPYNNMLACPSLSSIAIVGKLRILGGKTINVPSIWDGRIEKLRKLLYSLSGISGVQGVWGDSIQNGCLFGRGIPDIERLFIELKGVSLVNYYRTTIVQFIQSWTDDVIFQQSGQEFAALQLYSHTTQVWSLILWSVSFRWCFFIFSLSIEFFFLWKRTARVERKHGKEEN